MSKGGRWRVMLRLETEMERSDGWSNGRRISSDYPLRDESV